MSLLQKRLHLSQLHRFLLLTLILSALATLLFFPGLHGGFLFDDKPNIVQNFGIHIAGIDHLSLWRATSSFPGSPGLRPLAMLSFAIDYWLFGLNPVAFKLTNLAIHTLTCCVLAGFFRQLFIQVSWQPKHAARMAVALALLWAVHPLQVSSVLYVVQRMQTLGTMFLVLALWAYLLARQAQITDQASRHYWQRTAVCWLLAIASKEDSVLLPAYTLALELTVLRFNACKPNRSRNLQITYAAIVIAGCALFLLWALPHFWSSATFPGRNFNSYERLLTQGRVLVMYLGQIFWPEPSRLPFYYDDYVVSHSWLQPSSTLWAWLLLTGLLLLAVLLQKRRPLLALGLFLFFAGHFITSNVLGLELAFEHRNHFPMIGIILAAGDLWILVFLTKTTRTPIGIGLGIALLAACCFGTFTRATIWGNSLALAEAGVKFAPTSPRAWISLCRAHYDLSKNVPSNPHFSKAIAACEQGGKLPTSAMTLANVVILKSIRGDVTQSDWNALLQRMKTVAMSVENAGVALNLVKNSNRGTPLDLSNVITVIDIVQQRTGYTFNKYIDIARFMLHKAKRPDLAYHYLAIAVSNAPPDDPNVKLLLKTLKAEGHTEWYLKLSKLNNQKTSKNSSKAFQQKSLQTSQSLANKISPTPISL